MIKLIFTSKLFRIFVFLFFAIFLIWYGKETLSSILKKDAINYAHSHNTIEAIKKIDRAIWFNKKNQKLYLLKSHILSCNGKQKESISVLKQFLELSDDVEGVNLSIGFNFDELKQEDSARFYYLKELNYCQNKVKETYRDDLKLIDLNYMLFGGNKAKLVADSLDKLSKYKTYTKYLELIENKNYDTTQLSKFSQQLQNCPDYHFNTKMKK